MFSKNALLLFSFVMFSCSTFAQSNDRIRLIFGDSKSNQSETTESTITIKRNTENPFLSFENELYKQSVNGKLKIFDVEGNAISPAELIEELVVIDTANVINFDTYEEIVTVTKSQVIGDDFNGCDLDMTLERKGKKIKSKISSLSPFTFNGNQKRVEKLYTISIEKGCKNPDYGFLISANLDQKNHPKIAEYLFDIIDDKSNVSLYDSRLEPLSRDELSESMIHADTSVVMDFNTYEEKIVLTHTEIDRANLELNFLGELTFCSQKGKFELNTIAVGLTENVMSSKTGKVKYQRILFLTKMD